MNDQQFTISYTEIAFILAAIASILVSVDSLFNAKMRWRQLRSGAGALESLIWCYRTRVGAFELSNADSRLPETALRKAVVDWRDNLVAGGDLQVSGMAKKYPPNVHSHGQFKEGKLEVVDDDFYSPVQPKKYIKMRIEPSIEFYQKRVPEYAKQRYMLKFFILACTFSATLMTRYKFAVLVVAVSSGAAAITSWQEFADTARKTERYTRAVFALNNLLSWWNSLGEVEKASRTTISELIHSAEAIISDERLGWISTAQSQPTGAETDSEQAEESKTSGNEKKQAQSSVRTSAALS